MKILRHHDRLLLDVLNKRQLQANNDVNESSPSTISRNLQPIELPDIDSEGVRSVVACLLELQLTDNHEVITNTNIDEDNYYDDEQDCSVVGQQHSDDRSFSSMDSGDDSYDPDKELLSESDNDEEEMDINHYTVTILIC